MSLHARSRVIPRDRSTSITIRRTNPNARAIADYANSMFRFERLNERWLEKCTAYVTHLFGKNIVGATVVDYAFGRGNWSLASRRAGASRVAAVDASIDNVRRFREYCAVSRVSGIDIIHGNILERRIDLVGDLIWVYGVLHHVREATVFVKRLVTMTRDPGSLLYFYAYDAGSLRQLIVETSRHALPLASEKAFRRVSAAFTPAARLRARDDLTAPTFAGMAPGNLPSWLALKACMWCGGTPISQAFWEGLRNSRSSCRIKFSVRETVLPQSTFRMRVIRSRTISPCSPGWRRLS